MASFDYMSVPPGPQISISLFGDAATAGISAGKNLPSTTTSIIQGGLKGIETGMDLQAKYQENQIRANQVEQLPVANQIQQEQLENAQITNDINALNLDIAQNTKELKLRQTRAALEAKALESEQEIQNAKTKDDIISDLTSGDPLKQKNIINNPNYKSVLMNDSAFAEQVVGSLAQQNLLSPEEKENAYAALNYSKYLEFQQRKRESELRYNKALLGDLDKTVQNIKEGQFPYLMGQYGLSVNDLATSRVKTIPSGVKNYTPEGFIDNSRPDNDLTIVNPNAGKFDVLVDGKKANILLSSKENDELYRWKQSAVAQGLVPDVSNMQVATPAPTPTPSSNNVKPISTALLGEEKSDARALPTPTRPPPSSNPIVEQRLKDLVERAKTDSDLKTRLIAKGITTPEPTPTPTVQPNLSEPTKSQSVNEPLATATNRGAMLPKAVPVEGGAVKTDVAYEALAPSVKRYVDKDVLHKIAKEPMLAQLDPLYKAVVALESRGKHNAKNRESSATGYFQLTDAAAKDVGVDKNIPQENVAGGVAYLNQMLARYGNNEIPALFAYHLGMGVVDSAINLTNSTDYGDLLNAFQYMKDKGMYGKNLKQLAASAKYPLQVLAYKEAFEALNYA